ncbi:hypothetical protein PL75_08525 [Neisseria arctica]|uniref:histidine kinase n=1 Tax=Neisseria arctica TaxID=1470200 RepID=A0A0J0YQN1_9NEIS|nr:ATP-binding protein [Neisseria arctica]KLT72430.1 hypothetical protein PL75_08525 [Neisseria arctica]UOO85996.1 HAMP domain-containing histidine kinase [Neisseria arctica]
MNSSSQPFTRQAYPTAVRLTLWLRIGMAALCLLILFWAQAAGQNWPFIPLYAAILTLTVANGVLTYYYRIGQIKRLLEWGLCADMLVLSEILYFSGGVANPLVSLYLPPLLLGALLCPPRFTWSLTAFSVAAYLLLLRFHQPFPLESSAEQLFQIHIGGMWLTFVLSAILITAGITRLVHVLNRQSTALAQAHARQQQNEQILSMGMEAAHLAHRLSTPLNSLFLLHEEWRQRQDWPHELQEDLTLMEKLLHQSRDTLWQLKPKQPGHTAAAPQMLYQTLQTHLQQWHNLRPDAVYRWQKPAEEDICVQLDPLFWSALLNLLNNAADAGEGEITLDTYRQGNEWHIGIRNRNGCLNPGQLQAAGLDAQTSTKPAGLGVGVLLSHATFSRMGGSLSLQNHPAGGVYAEIRIPLYLYTSSDKAV